MVLFETSYYISCPDIFYASKFGYSNGMQRSSISFNCCYSLFAGHTNHKDESGRQCHFTATEFRISDILQYAGTIYIILYILMLASMDKVRGALIIDKFFFKQYVSRLTEIDTWLNINDPGDSTKYLITFFRIYWLILVITIEESITLGRAAFMIRITTGP